MSCEWRDQRWRQRRETTPRASCRAPPRPLFSVFPEDPVRSGSTENDGADWLRTRRDPTFAGRFARTTTTATTTTVSSLSLETRTFGPLTGHNARNPISHNGTRLHSCICVCVCTYVCGYVCVIHTVCAWRSIHRCPRRFADHPSNWRH